MTALEAALDYLARGWSIFPLLHGSKKPACPWVHYQTERMTEAEARTWWEGPDDHGIAIVTGAISGLVVIDVDPRNGGDIGALEGIPPWRIGAATGGGGLHVLCRHPGGRVPCGKTSKPGIDRKGDGGYIVAPPSIHPSGKAYAWIINPSEGELAELPAWVLESPAPPPSPSGEPRGPWVAETLLHPERCLPGAQEETLRDLAWWASKHLPSEDIAFATLMQWASRLSLGNPHDPWTEQHVQDRLDRAYQKRALEPGAAAGVEDDRPGAAFEEVADLEFPEQAWIVEDFAAPGAFTELIGKVKKGKSTLAYQLVSAVRTGTPFLGRPTVQGGVIVLTEQTGTSLKSTLGRAGLLGARGIYVLRKKKLQELGGWAKAVHRATDLAIEKGIKLIVVDTLSRLAGLGGDAENKAGAVAVLDPFVRAQEAGIACIFVRHARKGQSGEADDIADAARGSSAITGEMDIVLRLAPIDGGELRCLSWESRITDDPEDVYLEYSEGVYSVVEKPEGRSERNERERLAEMRAALADGLTTFKELRERLGWSNDSIAKYKRMAATFTHGPGVGPIEE